MRIRQLQNVFRTKILSWFHVGGWCLIGLFGSGITVGNTRYLLPPGSISGVVVVAQNGETLPAANVMLTPGARGVATNLMGRFQIMKVPPGKYALDVFFIGFQTWRDSVTVYPGQEIHLQIPLEEQILDFPQITINAQRDLQLSEVNLSHNLLDTRDIRGMTSLSEPDLFRALATMPGVVAANDYNTRFSVRGGRGNENHVLIDGVTLHNPYHAFGFVSIFDVDAIKVVENYRGVFPAQYSQRLSSVTNVVLRDGNAQRFSGMAMLSPITSKFLLEGPLLKYNAQSGRKWTFMLGGRRTYLDLLKSFVDILPFHFWDLSTKTVFDSGKRTRLIMHGFLSQDHIEPTTSTGQTEIHWKNRAVGAQWFHFFNSENVFNFTLGYSDFKTNASNSEFVYEFVENFQAQKNQIKEFNCRSELDLSFNRYLKSTIGYQYSRFSIDEFLQNSYLQIFQGEWRRHQHHQAYLSLKGKYKNLGLVELGVSELYFSYPAKFKFSPRLGLKWLLTDRIRIKSGYGRHFQALTTINDEDDAVVLFDAWIPCPKERPIPRVDHWGLGIEFTLSAALDFNLEGYYRRYAHLTRINRTQMKGERLYLDGWAESFGADLTMNYRFRRFHGTLTYSWGKATSHFILRNIPVQKIDDFSWQSFPSPGDIRHNLNLFVNTTFREKWHFSVLSIFQTGRPYTARFGHFYNIFSAPSPIYMLPGNWLDLQDMGPTPLIGSTIYSKKNQYRFPFYQRIDIRLDRKFTWFNHDWQIFLQ
ncbi:TonB-dependent receptor, partial [candidate division KSB1 bacterium]|nr:TonB-dependent receptor [candidate division KSB1 bacterium]